MSLMRCFAYHYRTASYSENIKTLTTCECSPLGLLPALQNWLNTDTKLIDISQVLWSFPLQLILP